jgi:hypothetical protein
VSRCRIHLLFAGWTCFAVLVYSQFSQLGDSDAYGAGAYMDSSSTRTVLIATIASTLNSLTGIPLVAHLAFGSFAAAGMAYMATAIPGSLHWSWWAVVGNPNFGTWSAIVGREAVFVGLVGYCLGACLRGAGKPWGLHACVALGCAAAALFIREAFGAAVMLFVLASIILPRPRLPVVAGGVRVLVPGLVACWVVAVGADDFANLMNHTVLPKARSYFTIHSPTTRDWITLDTIDQYLASLGWMLPLSLLGPTPMEVLRRPVMLPSMLGGIAVVMVIADAVLATMTHRRAHVARACRWAWLPAMVVILFCYVPFGIYNPGSGIRYAASFLPFALYPRMLQRMRP